ncbi:LOW QUALITY PROTEIN: Gag protein [Phytophthora palmivora]|uniref:Gag protein n=1 Tax=Phytophthora palmivora TaxID=4796 RepID=A0A2P4YF07_9STRA|nr:LOW QUALITY PROTEIN: Gag protein [Phytophthora palmivora]
MDRGEFLHLTDAQFESWASLEEIPPNLGGCYAGRASRTDRGVRHERGLIAHVQGLQAPVAEMKPAQSKPLRIKVNPYEGKCGSHLDRATPGYFFPVQPGRLGEDLGVHARATTPGCFTTWAQLCQQLRAAFLPANYEYRQRSRFLAWKQGKRELHEYIQEMRVLAASLVGNPLPEHTKVIVFMVGLKVSPSRT